jgi:inorganic pyrophosphatase
MMDEAVGGHRTVEEGATMGNDVVEVVIEIPKGSRNKYEFDHERQVLRLDGGYSRRPSTPLTMASSRVLR